MDLSMRILIVDDTDTVRRVLRDILHSIGFTSILEADNGLSALDKLKDDELDFDLIISDWNMPQMNGLELLNAIRNDRRFSKYRDIPYLMLTSESQRKSVVLAIKAGVTNYLVKPFSADSINQKLREMFDQK